MRSKSKGNVSSFDFVVIGAGPAGLSAAIQYKFLRPKASVCVIERSAPFNKIGSVIRDETLDILESLGINKDQIGPLARFGDGEPLSGIHRMLLEGSLITRARKLGVKIIAGEVIDVTMSGSSVDSVYLKFGTQIRGEYFVDASGQASVIARNLGARKPSGPNLRAAYGYLHTDNAFAVTKNLRCKNGFLWVTPIPVQGDNPRYQVMMLYRENLDTVTHENYLDVFPELTDLGFTKNHCLQDPCGVFGPHLRQYPAFIYETETREGDNWASIGDASSILFDRVFTGIDSALKQGIEMATSRA